MNDIEKKAYERFPEDYREVWYDGFDHTGENPDNFTEDLNDHPRRAYIFGYKDAREDMGAKWKRIDGKPSARGIIIVARFEDGRMVDYDYNWACTDDYFGPNNLTWQKNIRPTHWMSASEYRCALGNLPVE